MVLTFTDTQKAGFFGNSAAADGIERHSGPYA